MEEQPTGDAAVGDEGEVADEGDVSTDTEAPPSGPDDPGDPVGPEPPDGPDGPEGPDGPVGPEGSETDGPSDPPPPGGRWRTWRFWVGGLGRVLITLGVLTLLFAAYQLWGTGITHARAQASLEREFESRRAAELTAAPTTTGATATTVRAPTTTRPPSTTTRPASTTSTGSASTTAAATSTTGPTTTVAPTTVAPEAALTEPIVQGDGIARIAIPDIDVDEIVVAGVSRNDLQKGPGHFPDTPLPGQLGNVAIAGHRTTYGAPFGRLDELEVGDVIEVTTFTGDFRYIVTEQLIVNPRDTFVVGPSPDATLTLTTCHPKYSARQRLVIKASLDVPESSPVAAPTPNAYDTSGAPPEPQDAVGDSTEQTSPSGTGSTTASPDSTTGATVGATAAPEPSATSVDELTAGWFSDSSAWLPTIAWAAFGGAVAAGAWVLARRWRRVPAYVLAALPLGVILYFFFENLSRLLPPSI